MAKSLNIRIPARGKTQFAIPNTSDIMGNIHYTKNVNFNEDGYIKLSSRTVNFDNEKSDSNFGLPLYLGRAVNDTFYIATSAKNYVSQMPVNNLNIITDPGTSVPTNGTQYTGGVFFNNKWHVTISSTGHVWSKDPSTGNWTDRFSGLSNGVALPMVVHKGNATLIIGSNNQVFQLDTSYSQVSAKSPLVLPADLEVTALAYSNDVVGIATKFSNTANWQNQESVFAIWDAQATSVNNMYFVGSDTIICLITYKTSFAMLTRRGRLLYFNGSGFTVLATLPFNFKNYVWSDPVTVKMFGNCMTVEDDLIYINLPTAYNGYGTKGQTFIEQSPSGMYCYDPSIGLYHRYSPSFSLLYYPVTTAVNTTTDTITATGSVLPITGSPLKYVFDSSNPIGGLSMNTVYYIINLDGTNFKLATTKDNADAGIAIDLTSAGATTHKFVGIQLEDYGISYVSGLTGGMSMMGSYTSIHDHMIFGSQLIDGATGTNYGSLCFTIPGFENRGYVVTTKFMSSVLDDNHEKVFLKYAPLKINDAIVVKIQTDKIIGIPVSSPQVIGVTTWTSSTSFTTTCNISEAYTWFNLDTTNNNLECEIISGSGAGQMSQITAISLVGSTYTVTVADTIVGASNGRYLNFIINNWSVLKSTEQVAILTSANTKGYAEYPIAKNTKWCKIKVELRGVDTTIEELLIDNSPNTPAV